MQSIHAAQSCPPQANASIIRCIHVYIIHKFKPYLNLCKQQVVKKASLEISTQINTYPTWHPSPPA